MELTFIFYIFAAFIFIPGTYFLLSMFNKSLAGGIAAMGMLTFFILFGLQLYNTDGSYKIPEPLTNWPPGINQCPDFLTLFKMPGVAAVGDTAAVAPYYVCVDTVGIAPQTNSSIEKFVFTNSASLPSEQNIFKLSSNKEKNIQECKDKNVTWEGIWDGIQAYPNNIPKPPAL